jgi:hypothetical protein
MSTAVTANASGQEASRKHGQGWPVAVSFPRRRAEAALVGGWCHLYDYTVVTDAFEMRVPGSDADEIAGVAGQPPKRLNSPQRGGGPIPAPTPQAFP